MTFAVFVLSSVLAKQAAQLWLWCARWGLELELPERTGKSELGEIEIVWRYLEADVKLAWFFPRFCLNLGFKLSLLSAVVLVRKCEEMDVKREAKCLTEDCGVSPAPLWRWGFEVSEGRNSCQSPLRGLCELCYASWSCSSASRSVPSRVDNVLAMQPLLSLESGSVCHTHARQDLKHLARKTQPRFWFLHWQDRQKRWKQWHLLEFCLRKIGSKLEKKLSKLLRMLLQACRSGGFAEEGLLGISPH